MMDSKYGKRERMVRIRAARYPYRQQVAHWITALLMFAILPVAWVLVSVVEESKAFFFWMDVHEALGLALLLVTGVRLTWRLFDGRPAADPRTPRWMRAVAQSVHCGLFAALILMPVSGYIWATGHGHDVAPFNLVRMPRIAFGQRPIGDLAERVHLFLQWVIYALVALHLLGVAYHVVVVRDGLLSRMLPPQSPAEPAQGEQRDDIAASARNMG